MPAFLADIPPLYLLVGALVIAGAVLRRVPVVGGLLAFASFGALIALLVITLGQRASFDPYLGDLAAALRIEEQKVVGDEVRVRMAPDGHFWIRARIDGIERRMLVDSGATVTALSPDTAAAAGLDVGMAGPPVLLSTANGVVQAETSRVGELRLGSIVARGLPVVVAPGLGDTDVVGMNFLSRLKSWRVEGRTLILVPHHPQPVDKQ